jgi:phosphoglycolate phosphatase
MFTLSALKKYGGIVIQCHDNPDADGIASAFALYSYFLHKGKQARIVYGGKYPITKPVLLEMIRMLAIPIRFVREIGETDALVITDGQYGAENVTFFAAENVYEIDHHIADSDATAAVAGSIINPLIGSCSTIVWDLLRKENFSFASEMNVSTALYYGLYTDTRGFTEIYYPLDKDMRDYLCHDAAALADLRETCMQCSEVVISGVTLKSSNKTENGIRYSIFKADPCDPAALSAIGDMALSEENDACVVYSETADSVRVSVSSRVREVMASDFIGYITENAGFGGGCAAKGSGYVMSDEIAVLGVTADEYIDKKTADYFACYDMVDAAAHNLDVSIMPLYKKKKIPIGYVPSADIFGPQSPIMIRTLEGDAEATVSDDIYIMVGIFGEAYPIRRQKFMQTYKTGKGKIKTDYLYSPTVRNRATGEVKELRGIIKPCVAKGSVTIHARPVTKVTKVFTSWNTDGYMLGKPGDYIAVRSDDYNDVYIVRKDIFDITYERQETVTPNNTPASPPA